MLVHCPTCKGKAMVEDVNLDRLLAKCRSCNTLFDIADQVGRAPREHAPPVPQPEHLRVEKTPSALVIRRRWFRMEHLFLAFFCAAWDGFLIFWYTKAFQDNAPWLMRVFPIAHLAVGIGLTYYVLAGFLNRTTVDVSRGRIAVSHVPIPWRGNVEIPVGAVRRIYSSDRNSFDNRRIVWDVCAVSQDGREIPIVRGLPESSDARFIADAIARHLGLATS